MILKSIILVAWALMMLWAAFNGKVKLNSKPVSWPLAIIVGPVVALVMGVMFFIVGVLLSIPVWIWFIPTP